MLASTNETQGNNDMTQQVTIRKARGKFFAFAGEVKLTRGFTTAKAAQTDYEGNREFYDYWANSAGVSIQNTPAVIVAC